MMNREWAVRARGRRVDAAPLADSPPGTNGGKDGAVTPSHVIRRRNAPSSAFFVEEGGAGSHDAVEGSALLSIELVNTVVLQSPQLVVVVLGQLLDDLVRQVAWGRVDRRRKVDPAERRQRSM